MDQAEKKPETKPETLEEKRRRLAAKDQARQDAREQKRRELQVERMELADRLEEKHGPEGQAFLIYDATELGEGFFAVKRSEAIPFNKYMDVADKATPADRYDLVSPCVVHPTLEQYQEVRQRLHGLDLELSNRVAKLSGIAIKLSEGK